MSFRRFLENSLYDELLQWASSIEHQAMNNPDIQGEFKATGTITSRTLQKALGISEGEANFLQRFLVKRHNDPIAQERHRAKEEAEYQATLADNFYYHVTDAARVPQIMKNGLRPGQDPMFSNYTNHSADRLFLTEKGGIGFWKQRVEEHAFHNSGHEIKVAVLRIPKAAVGDVEEDSAGTLDSHHPSYFTTHSIPAEFIEVVG